MGKAEHEDTEDRSFFKKNIGMMDYIVKESSVIATRKLYFSLRGEQEKNELVIQLYAPIQVGKVASVATNRDELFVCYVDFSHLSDGFLFYGYDEFQAIDHASNLDPLLRLLNGKCNLYFSGNDECIFYFDDDCNYW